MSFALECKKMRRTGLAPAFFWGGILSAAIPVLNMAVRAESYLGLQAAPVQILMDANWQMMAMLNVLLIAAGACLTVYTEYADNAIQRMCTLPMKASRLFFGKAAFLGLMCIAVLIIEALGVAFCAYHWFEASHAVYTDLMKSFGYALLLMLPSVFTSLFIASLCRNMWVSLGICVVCVFTATMLPAKSFALSLFPFALPFQALAGTAGETARNFMLAAGLEILILGLAELLSIWLRRTFA